VPSLLGNAAVAPTPMELYEQQPSYLGLLGEIPGIAKAGATGAWNYLTNTPLSRIPSDVYGVGERIVRSAIDDPVNFAAGLLPGVGTGMSADDAARLAEQAKAARAGGDEELARKFEATAAVAVMGLLPFAGTIGRAGRGGERTVINALRRTPQGPAVDVPQTVADALARRTAEHVEQGGVALMGERAKTGSGPIPVTAPSAIRTAPDIDREVERLVAAATTGVEGRPWYSESARGWHEAVGGDLEATKKAINVAAVTSPQTPVHQNAMYAVRGWNQAAVGDPIHTGNFYTARSKDVSDILYGNMTPETRKIGAFGINQVKQLEPSVRDDITNDIQMMHGGGFTSWDKKTGQEVPFRGTPTVGEDNYVRVMTQAAQRELNRRGIDTGGWTPEQVQAAVWTAAKMDKEGTAPGVAAQNFATGLNELMAQQSWESAPGKTSNHFPEYHAAPYDEKQAYHAAIRGALIDPQGHDIISRHVGMLTGQSVDAPGFYKGVMSPGTQSRAAVDRIKEGLDPASFELLNTTEIIRAALLRQDAYGHHSPKFLANLPYKQTNMLDARIGRPLTPEETEHVAKLVAAHTGSDFFAPIGSPTGVRFLNVPEYSGVPNRVFNDKVHNALAESNLSDVDLVGAHAITGYGENDWSVNPHGQSYLSSLYRGRPHLQRAAEEIFSTLGPKIAAIEDEFARQNRWTPDRSTRFWEAPGFRKAYEGVETPNPRRPWISRPGPDEPGGVLPGLLDVRARAVDPVTGLLGFSP